MMGDARADGLPRLGAEDLELLAEIRAFLAQHWPVTCPPAGTGGRYAWTRPGSAASVRAWFDALVERGWSVPEWPVEHGGTGWSPLQRYLWNRELALAEAPAPDRIGVDWAGPALIAWGDAVQRAALLPGIRAARERWCLGFAEPEAGSDPTRLQTRANPAPGGDGYVVEGLKSWVSGAQEARWMLTLVRTGAESATADDALTLLIVDLRTPGVGIEPVRMLDGSTGICRVWLDRVVVPAHQRLGVEGAGWRLHEALGAQAGRRTEPAAALRLLATRLGTVAAELPGDDGPLAADPGFARKLAELGVDLAGLEALELRVVSGQSSSERHPRRDGQIAPAGEPLATVLRLRRTGISQRIGELFVEAFGYYSLPYPDPLTIDNEGPIGHDYALAALQGMLAGRSLSIDGGTSEVLRDRIAHQVFGY